MIESLLDQQKKIQNLTKQLRNRPINNTILRNTYNADYQFEILIQSIKEFENQLNDQQEIAVQLASFGQSVTLNVTSIGYINPSIIKFKGFVNGQFSELIQNVSQLNFLLMAVPKEILEAPPRRIGFCLKTSDDCE